MKRIAGFSVLIWGVFAGTVSGFGDAGGALPPRRPVIGMALYGSPLPFSRWNVAGVVDDDIVASTRSIPLAFGMSALVPGLGQAYNRDWVAAGIFVAAEVALLTAWLVMKNNGNQGIEEYEQFADNGFSPIKYAEWLNGYSGYDGAPVPLPSITDDEFRFPDMWTSAERAEVNAFFDDIQAAERQSIYLTTGASFSHVLPYHGEQQYYELIGKYFQFAPGWRDYEGQPDDDPRVVMPPDSDFYFYSVIHAEANDDLRRASWAGVLVVLNHFAAGAEAAVSAKLHNNAVRPSLTLSQDSHGELIANAAFAISL